MCLSICLRALLCFNKNFYRFNQKKKKKTIISPQKFGKEESKIYVVLYDSGSTDNLKKTKK
jgi:hypothetical protein